MPELMVCEPVHFWRHTNDCSQIKIVAFRFLFFNQQGFSTTTQTQVVVFYIRLFSSQMPGNCWQTLAVTRGWSLYFGNGWTFCLAPPTVWHFVFSYVWTTAGWKSSETYIYSSGWILTTWVFPWLFIKCIIRSKCNVDTFVYDQVQMHK